MRILIADDDATSRLTLKAIATKAGHECLVAEDGSGAWQLLSEQGIEVLLTDWMMPGVDGPELCRRVREELPDGYVYIVLITALGHPEQVLEGMNAGADDYLVKPVDPFAVRTRLIAAERVTALHRQVAEFRARLEDVNRELLTQSLTDALTGLGNRRCMEDDLARAHARALRDDRVYGVALFDIDHFKLYNDHYGHQVGDQALRDVAACVERVVRAGDRTYRYGGEEFLLLLPDCRSPDAVAAAAERVRGAIAASAMPHAARPSPPPILTVSAGCSSWQPGSTLTVAEVVKQADEALYRAKAGGRNRVDVTPCGEDDTPSSPQADARQSR